MSFELFGDQVLVSVMTGGVDDSPYRGEVVLIGPGRGSDAGTPVPMRLAIGDMVVFNRYETMLFEPTNGLSLDMTKQHFIVNESDVIGTVE